MKKKLLAALWCVVPVLVLAFHFGPGQRLAARDQAAAHLAAARAAERTGDWSAATEAYAAALAALPDGDAATRVPLTVAHAKARMFIGELPEAMIELENLLGELQRTAAPAALQDEVRAEAATAQYYVAWLMRLEGAATDEWLPETEQARQHFRLLAEQAGETEAGRRHQENLEHVIRLARMDLTELQALPLPKQCEGCKNASQKCRSQRESQCKKPGEKPKDARNAGGGQRPDGSGS